MGKGERHHERQLIPALQNRFHMPSAVDDRGNNFDFSLRLSFFKSLMQESLLISDDKLYYIADSCGRKVQIAF